MPDYHRFRVPGGCYFFTVNLLERYPNDLLIRHVDVLRAVVREVQDRWPFVIDGWVVMPDHLHCIWTLPLGDDDFTNRWRLIKAGFARRLPKIDVGLRFARLGANEVSGNAVSGNMRFAMNGITLITWIICITTRSNTGMCPGSRIGRIRVSTDAWRGEYIRLIGVGCPTTPVLMLVNVGKTMRRNSLRSLRPTGGVMQGAPEIA